MFKYFKFHDIVLISFLLLAIIIILPFYLIEQNYHNAKNIENQNYNILAEKYNKCLALYAEINSSKDLGKVNELKSLLSDFKDSSFDYIIDDFVDRINLKISKILFNEADDLLKNTVNLSKSLPVDHQIISDNINKITFLLEYSKKYCDYIKNNNSFDFCFFKGNLYYRGLQVLADEQTSTEYYNQCLENYKKANNIDVNNSQVIANIEVLLKKYGNGESNNGQPMNKNAKILIQAGASHLKGN